MRISNKNRSHLFASAPYKLALGLSVLVSFETEAQSFRQGFWNAQIKESTSASTDSDCGYGGLTDGAETVNQLNALDSVFYAEELTPFTPGSTTTGDTRCKLKNLQAIANAWSSSCTSGSTRCSGLPPMVVGMIPVSKLVTATNGTPIEEGSVNMSTITSASGVEFAVGVDDMHTALQDYGNSTDPTGYSFPNGVVTISEIETSYGNIASGIKFLPYLEAGRALYYVGDSVRMGVKNSSVWNTSTSSTNYIQSSFIIPTARIKRKISFPIADLYTTNSADGGERRHLFLSVESSTDGGATWTCEVLNSSGSPEPIDLLNNGDSNVKLLKVDVDVPRNSGIEIRFTLATGENSTSFTSKGYGDCKVTDSSTSRVTYRAAQTNKPKMVVIGMPKITKPTLPIPFRPVVDLIPDISFTPSPGVSSSLWFGDLLRSSPTSYSVTHFVATSLSGGFSEITPDENRLVTHASSSPSRKHLDGLMFKLVEESSYDADLHALFLEAICRISKSHGLECLEVGWGNSLQMADTGLSLNPAVEAQRFETARGIADGYVNYNAPLAYRAKAANKGIYSEYANINSSTTPSLPSQRIGTFLWPNETRMINGYKKQWSFTVPSGVGSSASISFINSTVFGGTSCLSSGTPLWTLTLKNGATTLGSLALSDSTRAGSISFTPRAGDNLTLSTNSMTSPASLCGANIQINWGGTVSTAATVIEETPVDTPSTDLDGDPSTNDEVYDMMTCLSDLFTGAATPSCPVR